MMDDSDISKRVILDVGGTHFTTTMATLKSEPGSMLHSMFSGNFFVEEDENGRVFIDRDGQLFRYILFWLRNRKLPSLPDEDFEALLIEAEYYNLLSLVEHIKTKTIEKSRLEAQTSTKVVTIVNTWSSYPGISIKTAQSRIQAAIEKEEFDGWTFINSVIETCKQDQVHVSTVNLVYLFFQRKGLVSVKTPH